MKERSVQSNQAFVTPALLDSLDDGLVSLIFKVWRIWNIWEAHLDCSVEDAEVSVKGNRQSCVIDLGRNHSEAKPRSMRSFIAKRTRKV